MQNNYDKFRAAQLQSCIDNLAADPDMRIPLDQLRGLLTSAQMETKDRRYHELREQRLALQKSFPNLSGDAALYWQKAQKAFAQMSRAKSDSARKVANHSAELALEIWEHLTAQDQALFHEPSENDRHTGKAGIDNLEWPLPRLEDEAYGHPEFYNIEGHVQWEALTDAVAALVPPAPPDENIGSLARLIREVAQKNND